MAYNPQIPAPVSRVTGPDGKPLGLGLTFANTLFLNSTGTGIPLALADELKGGLQAVEYLEYLHEDSYRGVFIGHRQEGMIAYVARHYDNGADRFIGKYFKLASLSADGVDAVWEEMNFGQSTLSPSRVIAVATIAERDALAPEPPLAEGDIVIVADASGDASVVPALVGGASYVRTGNNSWLRLLFPEPNIDWHKQNTDTTLQRELPDGTREDVTAAQLHEHMHDASLHFRINDQAQEGLDITLSVTEIMNRINAIKTWSPEFNGDGTKVLHDDGVWREVQTRIRRIDGGSAATIWDFE
jgi:hypothetical protein